MGRSGPGRRCDPRRGRAEIGDWEPRRQPARESTDAHGCLIGGRWLRVGGAHCAAGSLFFSVITSSMMPYSHAWGALMK